MARLFSPLRIGPLMLTNRIVRAPLRIGAAAPGGFTTAELVTRYSAWAGSGVGMIITEPLSVTPIAAPGTPGFYHDSFILDLRRITNATQGHGVPLLPLLHHAPLRPGQVDSTDIESIVELFEIAAWRAYAAGCQGVMLNGGDHSLLQQLHSPLNNHRSDDYGRSPRIQAATAIIERLRQRFGPNFVIGYRLMVDELRPDGINLQESRVAARQLAAAGANVLDIVAGDDPAQPVAHFPGWQIPLCVAIRSVVDIPVIANGGLGDPELAESVLLEGSADLIGIGETLARDPQWPRRAARHLQAVAS